MKPVDISFGPEIAVAEKVKVMQLYFRFVLNMKINPMKPKLL
jgi:hypothetical protein